MLPIVVTAEPQQSQLTKKQTSTIKTDSPNTSRSLFQTPSTANASSNTPISSNPTSNNSAPAATDAKPIFENPGNRYVIDILTMNKSNSLFTHFGHMAIMVTDNKYNTQKVYNFGTTNFQSNRYFYDYAKGNLNYSLSITSYQSTLSRYRSFNRGITIRTLNFNAKQARETAQALNIYSRPENRNYAYRHFDKNCTTIIRDLLDQVTNGLLSAQLKPQPTPNTYRYWIKSELRELPVYQTIISYLLGPRADKTLNRFEQSFLPTTLSRALDELHFVSNAPFVKKSKKPKLAENLHIPTIDWVIIVCLLLIFIVGLGIPIASPRNYISSRLVGFSLAVWGFMSGLGGALLILLWCCSNHIDTHCNENIMVTPVLNLGFFLMGTKLLIRGQLTPKAQKLTEGCLLLSTLLVLISAILKAGPFYQNNWEVISTALVLNTCFWCALKRITKIAPKPIKSNLANG